MTNPPDKSARMLAGSTGGNTETSQDMPLLIDAKAASSALAISERKLGSLTACNAIPSMKLGALRRYSPDELRAWVAAGCPTGPGSAEGVRAAMGEAVQR